jgi:prepilin-type N-terminal cleavage/methylation domain-containing protein
MSRATDVLYDDAEARGFTLVELLIVVVILGILAGIVVVALGGATGAASSTACKTEARQFLNSYAAYQANHRGAVVSRSDTATMAANLYADGLPTRGTEQYLDHAVGQNGPAANAAPAPRWSFDATTKVASTASC